MEVIKSISEAFSLQPISMSVCTDYERCYDNSNAIKEIKLERLQIGHICGDPVEELYYVGYNFDGKKLFQYVAKSVNVHFEAVS